MTQFSICPQGFKWKRLGMLYHQFPTGSGMGNSPCFLTLSAVFTVIKVSGAEVTNVPFDEAKITTERLKQILTKLSMNTRSKYVSGEFWQGLFQVFFFFIGD